MRGCGILLHISSLPSAYGIGDLGPAAHAFAGQLARAGVRLWQFLPLNPTSTFIGNSPYSSPSAFAGNPLFISPEQLVIDGWISYADLDCSLACLPGGCTGSNLSRIDYETVTLHREYLLNAAFARSCARLGLHDGFQAFLQKNAYWLTDYARFVSIKAAEDGRAWTDWPEDLKQRRPEALADWDRTAARAILREQFVQYLFFSQWAGLREKCAKSGILLLADIPIYVTHDSADVWANTDYFTLDADMRPVTVSGVPPDYFSKTGQRWGNPTYRWDNLARHDFAWWKKRFAHVLTLADMARLDHFRGFCGYWAIAAAEKTAVNGVWKKAPGHQLFQAMRAHFGDLPFLAEDLGVITSDVRALMRDFNLPGMHVLQFAFGGSNPACNADMPYRHTKHSFVYTGTHDNAPTRAWFATADEKELTTLAALAGAPISAHNVTRTMMAVAFASVADWAVLPMQDVLDLGAEGRMNVPGVADENWTWRMRPEDAKNADFARLRKLAEIYGRLPEQQAAFEDSGLCPDPEY